MPGGCRGLQNRSGNARVLLGGFDSHTFPPRSSHPLYCDLSDESSTGVETPCLGIASLLVIEQRQMKAMPVVEIVEVGTEPLCVRWGKPKTLKHFASAGLRLGE